MKSFNQIEGYLSHSFYSSNFNLKNNGMIIQINIKGRLINRCILKDSKKGFYIKFKNKEWSVPKKLLTTKK